jgi:glycosyltransferase involved in cell wall biosynthesis
MEIVKLKNSIDVIIPSYRLDADFLIPILSLKKPDNWNVNYIIIADNPMLEIPKELDTFVECGILTIVNNQKNIGTSESRNKGIELAQSEWILFLDDDIIPNNDLFFQYINEINDNSNPFHGFVGVTRFPKAVNSFTKGIIESDILTFFSLAESYKEMAWGVTANLMVKRSAIGNFRFSNDFPKFGGGEDIDICLDIVSKVNHNFKTASQAVVNHPWWNNRIIAYKRFFRWAFGDSQLPERHPEFRYYNFPNIMESLFIVTVLGTVFYIFTNRSTIYLPLISGVIFGEVLGEWVKLSITKRKISIITACESALIRASNDLGRLIGNLTRRQLNCFFQRFDYFCDGKHIKFEKKWGFIKFSLYILFILIFYHITIYL